MNTAKTGLSHALRDSLFIISNYFSFVKGVFRFFDNICNIPLFLLSNRREIGEY